MARLIDISSASVMSNPLIDSDQRCRKPVEASTFALDIGFGLGIEIPDKRLMPGRYGDDPDCLNGDFSSWWEQIGIQILGIDPGGRMAVDDIIRQASFCFDDYGERTRLSVEQLRGLYTWRSSPTMLMLLADSTVLQGLGSLLGPIPRPAEAGFHAGVDLRLLIGPDGTRTAPAPVPGLDLVIGIGSDWYGHSPEPLCPKRPSPHAHVVRMLTAAVHQPGLICFDYGDLRTCLLACDGYASYRHFAGSLNRFDELLNALTDPDLIPVWRHSHSLLLLISSGIGIGTKHYSAISDAFVKHLPETCCFAVATALYVSRPETDDHGRVWIDVISG